VARPSLLLDTGPFVALLNRDERQHRACVEVFSQCQEPLLTTEAVLTETLYLLSAYPGGQQRAIDLILRGAVVLVPASHDSLRRAAALMAKYHDLPMDYADATLVALAEELGCQRVFTLDRRGFSVYRTRSREAFAMVPGPT
jgi:uncharacterized protein